MCIRDRSGLVEDQPRCEPPHGGPQTFVGCVGHLDEQRQGVVGVALQRVVESVQVELADLG